MSCQVVSEKQNELPSGGRWSIGVLAGAWEGKSTMWNTVLALHLVGDVWFRDRRALPGTKEEKQEPPRRKALTRGKGARPEQKARDPGENEHQLTAPGFDRRGGPRL